MNRVDLSVQSVKGKSPTVSLDTLGAPEQTRIVGGYQERRRGRPAGPTPEPTAGASPIHVQGPAPSGRDHLLTTAGLRRLQHSAGNAATVQLLSGSRPTPSPAPPALRRAYWEKVKNEYTWHGGDEQPPEGYVKLDEAQKGNPNNKKKLYDVYGPAPTPRKKKPKKKGDPGGTTTAPPQTAQGGDGGAKKPLKKGEATKQAKQAPVLVEDAETQALEAATQMQRAGTPALAVAAAKGAREAAAKAKDAANKLSELAQRLTGFPDIAEDVRRHETCALTASEAAAKFSAQATRLADVVEARAKAQMLAKTVEDEKVQLEAARTLAVELAQEVEYLGYYFAALSRDLATVGGGGTFTPTIDPRPMQAQILLDIGTARRAEVEATVDINDLEASVSAWGKEHSVAAEDVPVRELAVMTGAAGLEAAKGDLESRRTLRTLAGGETNLSVLLALPRFAGSLIALQPYLDTLKAAALKPAAMVSLLSSLSATRSEVELGTMATAIAGGADLAVTVALATVDPKVPAVDVALFARVQQTAACKVQVVLDLLPARTAALYATLVVLTQLAVLVKDGASATRMAEIIVAEPTLPTTDLVELTQIFTFYPAKDDMVVLAKMVKEGMKGGRTSADVTLLLTGLEKKGVGVPAAAHGQSPPSVGTS